MRLWHISDSHNHHEQYIVPKNIDVVIFSGDCSQSIVNYENEREVLLFMDWMSKLDIERKIFVGGNHDISLTNGTLSVADFREHAITYLENSYTLVEGLLVWGSPVTPHFQAHASAFCKPRMQTHKVWDNIHPLTDILVTHGPPKGILDLCWAEHSTIGVVGDANLSDVIRNIKPKLHLFGHVHNSEDFVNTDVRISDGVIYSNSAGTETRRHDKGIIYNGTVFDINRDTKEIKVIPQNSYEYYKFDPSSYLEWI